MKVLKLKLKTAQMLNAFYGGAITGFYNLVVKAAPEFGARAPVRLEFVIEDIAKSLMSVDKELENLENEFTKVKGKSVEATKKREKINKQVNDLREKEVDIELGDDKYNLAKKVFDSMGAEAIWGKDELEETVDEKGKTVFKKKRVNNLLFFPGNIFLEIAKAFDDIK